jgi:UDP-N-acetylglucosamine--N-acetylmuramyl-(pentapeptide) pyrophosphoryl-undecaprenol N-acetylglucosamine transferase
VAVAEALVSGSRGTEVLFVGTARGIEARVLPGLGLELKTLSVRPLRGGGLLGLLRGMISLPYSGWEALRIVRRFRPDVVVSVGGYAAGPVTLVASLLGIPTVLLEQNALPGLTNRILGKVVDQCLLSMPVIPGSLPDGKCEVVGNPIRRQFVDALAADSDGDDLRGEGEFRLFVTGGSGGAGAFNRDLPAALCRLPGHLASRLVVRHQAGRGRHEPVAEAYDSFGGTAEVVEFVQDMAAAYRWADLVVCRAGATTLAELLALGQAALLIPFPGAADNHQEKNALAMVERGAGVMVHEPEIEAGRFSRLLIGFMQNPTALDNVAAQAKSLGRPGAAAAVASRLVRLAGRRG